jgi:hypothetical protein
VGRKPYLSVFARDIEQAHSRFIVTRLEMIHRRSWRDTQRKLLYSACASVGL